MEGNPTALERQLQSLKRRGSNLLVLADPAADRACQRLLGSNAELRRRLLVTTHGNEVVSGSRDPATFGLCEVAGSGTRTTLADTAETESLAEGVVEPGQSVPTTAEFDAAPDWFSRTPTDPSLATVARHLHSHLSRFEAADPDAGEIRVCFDSLDPLVDDVSPARLARFLRVVTARIKVANAIGHFHLAGSVDDEIREKLEPLFDATIETRPGPTGPQQRWTLHRTGLQTDWLQLD